MFHWIIVGIFIWFAACSYTMSWLAACTARDKIQFNWGRVYLIMGIIFSILAVLLF